MTQDEYLVAVGLGLQNGFRLAFEAMGEALRERGEPGVTTAREDVGLAFVRNKVALVKTARSAMRLARTSMRVA